jgi:hypothetical protein
LPIAALINLCLSNGGARSANRVSKTVLPGVWLRRQLT